MDKAASKGHLHVVKWLHENRTEGCTSKAMSSAAVAGHLHVVKWLHENRYEGCNEYTAAIATKNGHVDVVKFLLNHRITDIQNKLSKVLEFAVQCGHIEIVKWFYEKSDDQDPNDKHSGYWDNESFEHAMHVVYQFLDIKMIRFLYENENKILKLSKWQKFLDMNLDDQFS
jgi:hypothetical protein